MNCSYYIEQIAFTILEYILSLKTSHAMNYYVPIQQNEMCERQFMQFLLYISIIHFDYTFYTLCIFLRLGLFTCFLFSIAHLLIHLRNLATFLIS